MLGNSDWFEKDKVWNFQSKYSESSIRQVFLHHDEDSDDLAKVIIQTNEKSSIEIVGVSYDNQDLYCRTWCPQENMMQEEFDFMQISSCLYTKEFACIGFSNGSVRIYNFPKSESSLDVSLTREDTGDKIDDQYYNSMFGDSQEEAEGGKKGTMFWLDDPSMHNLPSRLLMKHMGYPICIKERNGIIYVLYDDGALMSTAIESTRGYNVIRYDETFQGGLYFSVSPKGDMIAVSNCNRKLLVSSLEVKELSKECDDGIRSCKLLFESQIFKKSSFQSSQRSKAPYNSLEFEWSSCGEYIYLPGESDVRVISVGKYPKEIKYFSSIPTTESHGLDICIIRLIDYIDGKKLLVSLSLMGEARVYLLEQKVDEIKELKMWMLREKSMNGLFPVSLDLMLVNGTGSREGGSLGENEKEDHFLYISSVLNSGELILNRIRIDAETSSRVYLVEKRRSSSQALSADFSYDEERGSHSAQNLLWDEEDGSNISDKGTKLKGRRFKGSDMVQEGDRRRRSGLRRLVDEEVEVEDDEILEDGDELEYSSGRESEGGVTVGDEGHVWVGSFDGEESEGSDRGAGFEDEDEDEYEGWDKREFGRHIEYLKGRIERLKSIVNSGNESQPPVQPGFTGDCEVFDSLNEENREFLFCWNQSGYVSYSIDDGGRPSIDMECYNSVDGPKRLRVYDTKGYNMACIGMDGYLLGRKSKVLENGAILPSIIDYNIWRTWGRSDKSGWSKTLQNGEDLVCMTCNRDFVAVMTSLRYLRIWRNSGISISVTKLVGSPVSCVSNDSYLLVVTQREPFYLSRGRSRPGGGVHESAISGRCNTYEVLFLDVGQETLIYSSTMSISPETTIKWCGISNKGVPIVQDTSGQAFMLSRQWKNQKESWVPVTNFGLLESSTSCRYFILGINDDYFNVLKLPDGLSHPIPAMARNGSDPSYSTIKIPFNIPILGLPSLRQWMNIIENDPTLSECITNNSISWEVIDELRIKLDLMQSSISMVDEFSCHKDSNQYRQYKLQREKLLMRLYMKLVIKQLVEPAFDVVRMFNFPKSFQIALEQAEKSGERILASRISQEIQMRSRYEQERTDRSHQVGKLESVSNLASVEDNSQSLNKNKNKSETETENLVMNEEGKSILRSGMGSSSDFTSSAGKPISKSIDSVRPLTSSFVMNNPFNTKSKSGVDEFPQRSSSVEAMGHVGNQEEISKTIQYCSDIIKRRKI